MERQLFIILIIGICVSLIGSAVIIAFVTRNNRKRTKEMNAAIQGTDVSRRIQALRGKWGWIFAGYYLICIAFIGIILYQSARGMENRALDCTAVLVGAVFFTIQACISRSKAVRRQRASARTSGTLVRKGTKRSPGASGTDSVYEFYAQGTAHQVRSPCVQGVEPGDQVELYYVPGFPQTIYIPQVEASDKWFTVVLYLIGAMLPTAGLIAPIMR